MTLTLTDETLAEIILNQLPRLLNDRPELKATLYRIFLESFADKGEVGRLRQELAEFRVETQANFERVDQHLEAIDQRFEQVDQRFDQVDQRFDQVDQRLEGVDQRLVGVDQRLVGVDQRFDRVEASVAQLRTEMQEGFKQVERQIDRLGQRWGIRSEGLFWATMATLLEKSFGVKVERRVIAGEEFDVIISNGLHVLVEIAASVRRNIQERLERKRALYTTETGVAPARFILAVASINSQRAQALREADFEVIEPEDEDGVAE